MIAARDLSIRTKLSAGFVLGFALIVAIGLVGVAQLRSINRLAVALTEVWIPEFEQLGNIRSTMVEYHQLAARRAEAVDARQLAAIDDRMVASRTAIELDGAAYAALADDPEEQRLYRDYVAAWTRYEETLASVWGPPGAGARRSMRRRSPSGRPCRQSISYSHSQGGRAQRPPWKCMRSTNPSR